MKISPDIHRLNAVLDEINGLYHAAAVKRGVADSVQQILYTICALGDGCSQADICRRCGVSKQTVNSAIRKMEAEGLLRLEEGEGRSMRVCLTGAGNQLMEKVAWPLIEAENRILESWSEEERRMHIRLNEKYRDGLKAQIEAFKKEET